MKLGDKVLTANYLGEITFAEVVINKFDLILLSFFMQNYKNYLLKICPTLQVFLPHATNDDVATFVKFMTATGKSVKATKMHLLQTCSGALNYAQSLNVGDCLRTVDGNEAITSVSITKAKGLYTAVTTNEFIVVNGILASPFAVAHAPAHAFYNIHRALHAVAPGLLKTPGLVSAHALLGSSAAYAFLLASSSN